MIVSCVLLYTHFTIMRLGPAERELDLSTDYADFRRFCITLISVNLRMDPHAN